MRNLGLHWLRKLGLFSWGRATNQKRSELGARNGVFRGRYEETVPTKVIEVVIEGILSDD